MTQVMGGIRARLLNDSLRAWLEEGLAERGWLDAGRRHRPITVTAEPLDWDQPIEPNLIAVTMDHDAAADAELGSTLTEVRSSVFVDFFAESDSLGSDVIYDVRDLLRGRFVSIGRGRMVVPVYDYRMATPTVMFNVLIDDVEAGKLKREALKPWQRHWFQARCTTVDMNGGEGYGEA